MSELNDFLKLELNESTKSKILDAIQVLDKNGFESLELNFNIYSLVISTRKSNVIIINDVISENLPTTVSLRTFLEAINNYSKK